MPIVRDAIYIIFALLCSPIWIYRLLRTGKYRTDWSQRFGYGPAVAGGPHADDEPPRVLIHAVSVGEVNAARLLVRELTRVPEQPEIIIATTTDTGYRRAFALFEPDHRVVRYPFDLSAAVRRFLCRVQPDVVVLIELELWPNFADACRRRGVPILVVNGRLSERSFRRYRLIAPLVRSMFRSLHAAAVQTDAYAERFAALGARPHRVCVTDTMKWDTAEIADNVDGAEELAMKLGLDRTRPLIVAGSTAPGEHELLMRAVPSEVQLLCAPRKPEWFDQAAQALGDCVRWSRCNGYDRGGADAASGRFLLDTIGELRRAYSLADLVLVGRTFVPLGGSDMIEPIALGKATIIGPYIDHFRSTAEALLHGDGLIQVEAEELSALIHSLLGDAARREALASNGRAVIERHQGATAKNARLIRTAIQDVRPTGKQADD